VTVDVAAIKARIADDIERRSDELVFVSHLIWDHPELCYEEQFAHDLLCDALESSGLDVTRGAYDIPTAFRATAGSEGPTVAICCEYDALPEIGHACGHNVIAAAGLGAGLAAAALADELGGRVVVLGTPAEEGGGGKVTMIERGALDGIDAAMMIHPADSDLDSFEAIAIHQLHVRYQGAAAHAAAVPEKGRNALDAAVLGYMGVAALRQHIESHERVHGIFTHGGDKPNIVPATAAMHWYVRSATTESLARLEPRVFAALEAGAIATGCTMTHEWSVPYEELLDVPVFNSVYVTNIADRGRDVSPRSARPDFVGSTDMGNVSHLVPSIHPMIKVAPDGVAIHTPEFAQHTRSPGADRAVLDGAIAMARTTVDLWTDPDLLRAVRSEFEASRAEATAS
jgi:amidohydrolase